jgi:exodeoxyribonuclease V alpha subunit
VSRRAATAHEAQLRAVDRALADALRRLDAHTDGEVLQAAALASYAVSAGHAALDLQRPDLLLDQPQWPQPGPWQSRLRDSRWVSTPAPVEESDPARPLVLEGGLLYLRRYREYERRLAAGLHRIAAHAHAPDESPALARLFHALFPAAADGDAQALAAALALVHSLLLVTGGPGTGKTTTIARMLLLLLAQARLQRGAIPRVALAAPTGRAADRMAESLRRAIAETRAIDGVDAALLDALPLEASTLHRLLGSIPGSAQFRHHAENPLPFDVVVVDEASMIDLPLMCKLVEAVADGARLVLLGDRDQLPSVEAGDVLAAITDAAGDSDAQPPALARWLAPLVGDVAIAADGVAPLAGHRVHLRRGYRQDASLELAPLADALREGDAERALALLRSGGLSGVHFHEDLHDPLTGAMRERLLAGWRAIVAMADPAQALRHAATLRLLTALRDGPQGASGVNARIEEALAGSGHARYFHGRLLLVHENDYRQHLFNGDLGVCLRDAHGDIAAWFPDGKGGVRSLHPSTLPAHGGAFATTVHKAQGSEADVVWLLLPRQDARPLSRELLYTAVTRARRELHVCGSEAVLRAALARHAVRVSGLQRRLLAGAPAVAGD